MKEFVGEILDPVKEFYQMRKWGEKFILLILPIVLAIVCFILSEILHFNRKTDLYNFANDILGQEITVLALLVSFSMAHLTILVTSSSKNIDKLKTEESTYVLRGEHCFLYQVLVSEITYTLIVEILSLLLAIAEKFLVFVVGNLAVKIMISIDVLLISHVLIMMLSIVKNIYFSFWKPR